jgi:hypothetical protein
MHWLFTVTGLALLIAGIIYTLDRLEYKPLGCSYIGWFSLATFSIVFAFTLTILLSVIFQSYVINVNNASVYNVKSISDQSEPFTIGIRGTSIIINSDQDVKIVVPVDIVQPNNVQYTNCIVNYTITRKHNWLLEHNRPREGVHMYIPENVRTIIFNK